jgi:hypothetical protein
MFVAGAFTVGMARYAALEFSPANAPATNGLSVIDGFQDSTFFSDRRNPSWGESQLHPGPGPLRKSISITL